MIENPKNIVEAAEFLNIDAALALLRANPDAWQETIDGKMLISVIISHLKNTPKSKKVYEFITKIIDSLTPNDLDVFITCVEMNTTLLHEAVSCNSANLIRLLIEHGVNRFILRPGDGLTAFNLAMENNALMALMALVQGMDESPLEDDRVLAVLTNALQINNPACFWSIVLGWCNILDPDVAIGLAKGELALLQLTLSNHPSRREIYFMMIEAALRFNLVELARNLIDGAIKTMIADDQSEILTVVLDHGHLDLAAWLLDIGVLPEIDKGNTGLLYSPTLEAAAEIKIMALIERLMAYPQITPEIVLNTLVRCMQELCDSEEGQSVFLRLLDHGNPSDFELIAITKYVVEYDCNELLKKLIARGLKFKIDYKHHEPMRGPRKFLLGFALLPYGNHEINGRFDCALTLIANGYLSYRASGLLLAGLLRDMAVVDEQPDLPLIEFLTGFGASPILLIDEYIRLCKKKAESEAAGEGEGENEDEVSDAMLAAYRTALIHVFTCNIAYLNYALALEPAILVHEARAMIALSYYPEDDLKNCINISGKYPELVSPAQALLDLLQQVNEKSEDTSRVPSLFEQTYLTILNAKEDDPNLVNKLNNITQQIGISPEICQRIVDIRNGYVFTLPGLIARRILGG